MPFAGSVRIKLYVRRKHMDVKMNDASPYRLQPVCTSAKLDTEQKL